jgi:hypothetical protein
MFLTLFAAVSDRQASLVVGDSASTQRTQLYEVSETHGEYEMTSYELDKRKWNASSQSSNNASQEMLTMSRQRRSYDDDSGHGDYLAATPTSPVTFKTTAAFIVTKMQLRSTFSIHFKVSANDTNLTQHTVTATNSPFDKCFCTNTSTKIA